MSDKRRRPVVGKLITPAATRSTTPLECKVLSPTGIINRDMGGIGLGIVAALENNIPAKNTSFSCRIPVGQPRIVGDREKREKASSLEEDYTIVTSQKSNKSIIKVYHAQQTIELRDQSCIFHISSASCGVGDDMKVSQPAGFLSSCYLCNKRLHGKDIYMYRGEKAFCSPECRNRQIAMDEKPEKYCSSQVSSSGTSHLITTVIFAT